MQKLKLSILENMTNKVTSKEIDFVLHISHYQDENGNINGVYYKNVCEELNISIQTFYNLKESLVEKNIIRVSKADYTDWDIQVIGNDFEGVDFNNLSEENYYISTNQNIFFDKDFLKLRANEKLLAMHFLRISNSGRGSYNIGVEKFYKKYTKLFGVTKRVIQYYMTHLRKFFSIGVKKQEYWITPLAKVYKKVGAPSDTTILNKHIGQIICRREKIQYNSKTLKDSVDLIKQYGNVLLNQTIEIFQLAVKKSIEKANKDINDKNKWKRILQPKLVHKVLKDEILALGF